jgi:hypothetical protein
VFALHRDERLFLAARHLPKANGAIRHRLLGAPRPTLAPTGRILTRGMAAQKLTKIPSARLSFSWKERNPTYRDGSRVPCAA